MPETVIKKENQKNDTVLISRSGCTPEELFDVLVSIKALPISSGSRLEPLSGTVRALRNAGKKLLRDVGVPHDKARLLSPTPQTIFIRGETSSLSTQERKVFLGRLLELERERVTTGFREVIGRLVADGQIEKELVKGAYLIGSTLSSDCWPEDIDLFLIVSKKIDEKTYWLIRNALEADLHKVVPSYPIVESEIDNKLNEWSKSKVESQHIGL